MTRNWPRATRRSHNHKMNEGRSSFEELLHKVEQQELQRRRNAVAGGGVSTQPLKDAARGRYDATMSRCYDVMLSRCDHVMMSRCHDFTMSWFEMLWCHHDVVILRCREREKAYSQWRKGARKRELQRKARGQYQCSNAQSVRLMWWYRWSEVPVKSTKMHGKRKSSRSIIFIPF